MPCPYMERRGIFIRLFKVYCRRVGDFVDLRKHPCLSDDYNECPHLKEEDRDLKTSEDINCLTCPFYSKLTKKCVKLKVRVNNPYEPPCVRNRT